MSDIRGPDQSQKGTETIIQRLLNSNILTTALTCSVLMVIFSVCYRPVKDDGGGDFDPSFTIQKKLAEFDSRLDNIEKLGLQHDLKLKQEQLISKNKDVQRKEIYFNAKLTANTVVTGGHTVIFDRVVENTEDSYNKLTGIFRAPVSGMYLFSLSVMSEGTDYVHTLLVKNGTEIGRIFADAVHYGQMGTITVVTHLEKGAEVYAKQMPGITGNMHGGHYCSFSGVLI